MSNSNYLGNDTIVAIATSEGVSAIGVIRMSGLETFSICGKVFKGKSIESMASHTVHYGFIVDGEEIVDEVMLTVFRAPKSFTTEDSIEISCHGSPYIQGRILQLLIRSGARLAQAGEFTQRAFMHGRIDLAQAEAVGDLIAAESRSQHNIALKQIRGGLSGEIGVLRQQLLDFASLIELELDFGEEDVEFADRSALVALVQGIITHIKPIIHSFQYGNAIKNGIPVAIVGRPNAGKSSLLNVLLNEERAIVSDIAGTTRDTIEEHFVINGISFRLIDTAGIRKTTDEIEAIGVRKTFEKIEKADTILYLFDSSVQTAEEVIADVQPMAGEHQKMIVCASKSDLKDEQAIGKELERIQAGLQHAQLRLIAISAKKGQNIEELKQLLTADFEKAINTGNTILTNARHFYALNEAKEALELVLGSIESHLTSDLIALEIKRALNALGEISGQISSQEILQNIFGKFCIGK